MTISVTAPATRLVVITSPPAQVAAGQAFGLTVAAEDASGKLDPTITGSVALALADNPGGGSLLGNMTAVLNNGVATFTGLTLDRAGTGYALQVSSGASPPSTTPPFNVTAAAATQLVVTSPPPPVIGVGGPLHADDRGRRSVR
jgi:hypothetical protein